MIEKDTSKFLKICLALDCWWPLFLINFWSRPLTTLFLTENLLPCNARAPYNACSESGKETYMLITEAHLGWMRLTACAFYVVLKLYLLRPFLEAHLRRGLECGDAAKNPSNTLHEVNMTLKTPYNNMYASLLQYLAPVLAFAFFTMGLKQQGQIPCGICHGLRMGMGLSPPFDAAGENPGDVGTASFWHPVWGFLVFWAALSNFVIGIVAIMYWSGKSYLKDDEEYEAALAEEAAKKKLKSK